MIYLNNITEAQIALIPRNGEKATGNLTLWVRNTTDQTEQVWDVADLNTSDIYFNLALELPEGLASGEYQYSLEDDGVVLSTGLLFIEDLHDVHEYNENIIYQQYESE